MIGLRIRCGVVALVTLAVCAAAPPPHETGPVANEPYRHLPTSAGAPAPDAARAVLVTTGGRTSRGLIVSSSERGPQVSLFIPPSAIRVSGADGTVVVAAVPVVPSGARVPGKVVSNVYALRASSTAGPVAVAAGTQSMALTLRGFETGPAVVTLLYRPEVDQRWRALPTRELGHHLHHADAPGLGEFVLSAPSAPESARRPWLWWVVGIVAALALVLAARALAHRLSSSRHGGLA